MARTGLLNRTTQLARSIKLKNIKNDCYKSADLQHESRDTQNCLLLKTFASYKKKSFFSRKETAKKDFRSRDANLKHNPIGMIAEFTGRK